VTILVNGRPSRFGSTNLTSCLGMGVYVVSKGSDMSLVAKNVGQSLEKLCLRLRRQQSETRVQKKRFFRSDDVDNSKNMCFLKIRCPKKICRRHQEEESSSLEAKRAKTTETRFRPNSQVSIVSLRATSSSLHQSQRVPSIDCFWFGCPGFLFF
jgi:hypothetical protein